MDEEEALRAASAKVSLVVPILLITLGIGWLMELSGVVAGVSWVWVLFLAVMGVMTFVLGGFDKFTIVLGPFLLVCTIMSLLRQTERVTAEYEIPILVIALGSLSLIARLAPLPRPFWYQPIDD